jgi:hypothetical protein
VAQTHRVAVTFEILIKHFSEGSYDRKWMEENLTFFDKWNIRLPFSVEEFSPETIFRGEKTIFKFFIEQLMYFNFPISTAFKVLWKNNKFLANYPKLFFKLNFYVFKKYLRAGEIKPVEY